jgi:hypothetical protein
MPEVKEKVVPPSPPLHIRDNEGRAVYMRVGFLGEVCLHALLFRIAETDIRAVSQEYTR